MISYANYSRFDDEETELGNDWGFYEDIEDPNYYKVMMHVRECAPRKIVHTKIEEKKDIQMRNIEKLLEKAQIMNRYRDEEEAQEVDRVSKYANGLTRGVIMSAILISIMILN